ncbi:MAG: patatin-like phospholipase family protein [candidate division WOR-3 bacterium]
MRKLFLVILLFEVIFAQPVRVGVALSGGAALGLAHIGVLKVLEREGIVPVGISGNSMGALVGGVYAAGYRSAQIESIALTADWNRLFSSRPSFGSQYLPERQQVQRYFLQLRHKNFIPYLPSGLVPLQNVEVLLNRLLGEIEFYTGFDFDSLPIPYRAVAVDINGERRVVLKKGRLEQAIRASIAIPGVFAPEVIEGVELVDGGVMEYLPVEPLLEFKPDFIIAVLTMRRRQGDGRTLIDIASRSLDLMGFSGIEKSKMLADVVIEPDLSGFLHSDFARAKELIAAGESAAIRALPLIKEKLKGKTPVINRHIVKRKFLPTVQKIRFEGARRTGEGFLRRYVHLKEKSTLSFATLFDDIERLFNTGLFEEVNYRLEKKETDSIIDVVFELAERPYGFYSVGLRYDNYDNIVLGFEGGEENILGSGAAARGAFTLGNPNEFRFGLTGTRIFWLPLGYRLDGFFGSINRSVWQNGSFASNYLIRYSGGLAEAGYILGKNGFFNIGIQGKRNYYEGEMVDTLKPEWVIGPVFNLEFNNQEDIYLARRGLAYRLNLFYATKRLKSSADFFRFDWRSEQILPIFSYVGLRFWSQLGFSLGELPLSDCFKSGGEGLIGFAQEEFQTNQRLILGLGLRFRLLHLFGQENYPLFLELLANGATFTRFDLLVKTEKPLNQIHWGAGCAVETNTPIGPLRFSWGIGDFRKESPHPGGIRFGFSVGREFRYTK